MDFMAMATRIASLSPWENLGETVHFSNNIVTVVGRVARSKETGFQKEFTVLKHPDWVHVVALTYDDEIVLVRQFRHGVNDFTLELPGGAVEIGEDPKHAALRELSEETGYVSNQWEPLGSLYANPALNTNSVHMFLARDVILTNGLPPDQGEELEIGAFPLETVMEMCHNGRILHPFTCSAVFALLVKYPELSPKL